VIGAVVLGAMVESFASDEKKSEDSDSWGWGHSIIFEHLPTNGPVLELNSVEQEAIGFFGDLGLSQRGTDVKKRPALIVRGHPARDGTFRPNMEFAVSNDGKNGWVVIESSFSDDPFATLTLDAVNKQIQFHIELDAFKPMIGKYKFGRIKLQSGESTVFPLRELTKQGLNP
jgi:hypothetical protein